MASIRDVLTANGKEDLLQWMEEFWLGIPSNEYLWANEWNRHGTCMSTIAPSCLPAGSPSGFDASIYFQKAADAFSSVPTYQFLASAGIEPDRTKKYTLDELEAAFKQTHGFIPALDCKNKELTAISYYFHLRGTLMDGTLVPLDTLKRGNCPKTGIRYLPKPN
ncbi:ribonuclease T2-like [Tulasnella sp. 417]|nr:ribonuclease T2-like [Tulasnella sp. 417]